MINPITTKRPKYGNGFSKTSGSKTIKATPIKKAPLNDNNNFKNFGSFLMKNTHEPKKITVINSPNKFHIIKFR